MLSQGADFPFFNSNEPVGTADWISASDCEVAAP